MLKSADLRELKGKVRKLFGEWGSQEEYRKRFRSQGSFASGPNDAFSVREKNLPKVSGSKNRLLLL